MICTLSPVLCNSPQFVLTFSLHCTYFRNHHLLLGAQSFFCGVGNIYGAEFLFVAGVHPNRVGNQLSRIEFDRIWKATVSLMERGFTTGSILTVDPTEVTILPCNTSPVHSPPG